MTRQTLAITPFLAALLLTSCTQFDAYHRPGVWEPTGANSANLAAMVADPEDLIHGHGSATLPLSQPAVKAVQNVWKGVAASGGGGGSSGGAGGLSGGGGATSSPGG